MDRRGVPLALTLTAANVQFGWRRLTIRYERRVDIHLAFTTLACALICWHRLQGRF